MDYAFTRLDTLLPHPTYAWSNWVCVLDPSEETIVEIEPLFDEAYDRARATFEQRTT